MKEQIKSEPYLTINLDELADQCFKVWQEIKQHKINWKFQEIEGKKPVGNIHMEYEIKKLKGLFND